MKKIRKYRNQRGVTRAIWRRPLAVLIAAVFILTGSGIVAAIVHGQPSAVKVSLANASLRSSQLVFTASQKPHLSLKLPKHHKSLSELLMPRADADSNQQPQVDVTYKNGDAYVPVTTTPNDSGYDITIAPNQTVRPGVYTVTATGNTEDGQPYKQTTTFAWGVLAVNTDQATYTPGQTVNLSMGVLDAKGHTKCKASLDLVVTDPSGRPTTVSYNPAKECLGDNYSSVPDYTAQYGTTSQAGIYKIQFGLHDSPYSVDSSFEVADQPPFTVQRTGATRFNPNYQYGMHLHVTTQQAFSGDVIETLPDSRFVVEDAGGATVTKPSGNVVLTWHVNWQAGQQYELGYAYNPPHQSPSFFMVGPLKLVANGKTVYQEGKGWQLAGDTAISFVKQTIEDSNNASPPNPYIVNVGISSTAGNTLILFWGCVCNNTITRYISAISDGTANSWTLSGQEPQTNPPASQSFNATTGDFNVAYVRNAAAISSLSVTMAGGAVVDQGYDLIEWSGIDAYAPTYGAVGNWSSTATTQTSGNLTLHTCDTPTTEELMNQGEWFCSFSPSYVVLSMIYAGKEASGYTGNQGSASGWTDMTLVNISGPLANNMMASYKITSASADYFNSWLLNAGTAKVGTWGIFAMGQDITGTVLEQPNYK